MNPDQAEFWNLIAQAYLASMHIEETPEDGMFRIGEVSFSVVDDREWKNPLEIPTIPPLRAIHHCKGCGLMLRSPPLLTYGEMKKAMDFDRVFNFQHKGCKGERTETEKQKDPLVLKQVRKLLDEMEG